MGAAFKGLANASRAAGTAQGRGRGVGPNASPSSARSSSARSISRRSVSRRAQAQAPQVNHERWMVSYADFITLLFAFFVVMYSISQVNEAKYKELSSTLNAVFTTEAKAIKPIQVGDPVYSAVPSVIDSNNDALGRGAFESSAELPQLETQLKSEFADLIEDDIASIDSNELWLQIELKSAVLFASAQAIPNEAAREIFLDIAQRLKGYDNQIQVEGFTDDQPITSALFPSNWELSTARAAAVVKLLVEFGLRPQRLSAVGYGEFQPIADNSSAQGRADNRRVVLMVSRRAPERLTLAAKDAMAMTLREQQGNTASQIEVSRAARRSAAIAEMREMAEQQLLQELAAEAEAKAATVQSETLPPLILNPIPTPSGGVLFTSDTPAAVSTVNTGNQNNSPAEAQTGDTPNRP